MFKIGDIVKLKSGGPAMTAQKVDGGKATCIWFKDDRLKSAIFRKDTIELVNPLPKADKDTAKKDDVANRDDKVPAAKEALSTAKLSAAKSTSEKSTSEKPSSAKIDLAITKAPKAKSVKPKKAAIENAAAENKNAD